MKQILQLHSLKFLRQIPHCKCKGYDLNNNKNNNNIRQLKHYT